MTYEQTVHSIMKKIGPLPEPTPVYAPLDPVLAVAFRDRYENSDDKTVKFPGVVVGARDPEVALQTGAHAVIRINATQGLRTGDGGFIIQSGLEYEIVDLSRSPGPDEGPRLEVFYLEEVGDA